MLARTAIIRADASAEIGTGHVRRCLVLARAMTDAGFEVALAAMPQTLAAVPILEQSAPRTIIIEGAFDDPAALRRAAPEGCYLLVVDHYQLDRGYEAGCRVWARRILAIDDLVDREHDCDILLDQTPFRMIRQYESLVPAHCMIQTGAAHALLDRRFEAVARNVPHARREVRRVLVSMGGSDPNGATVKVLSALVAARLDAAAEVVVGTQGADHARIVEIMAELPAGSRLHVGVEDMPALLSQCDMAVGAGGVSALERCCIGLPTLLMTTADNQAENAAALGRAGAAVSLGSLANASVVDIADAIVALAGDVALRERSQAIGRTICDGRGADRIARRIVELHHCDTATDRTGGSNAITLRHATLVDSKAVRAWRNDPETRANFRNQDVVANEQHARWYEDRLNSPSTLMLIGEIAGRAVGVIRFDGNADGSAEVSINIDPARRGAGIGTALLAQACELALETGFAARLNAEIKSGNRASIAIFRAAGFATTGEDGSYVTCRCERVGTQPA